MKITFSKHAEERIKDRQLDKDIIWRVLSEPDYIVKDSECNQVYQKLVIEESKYLYRVFVNICKQPNMVVTAYKTSKIEKYEH